jgi:HK97 family phage major capsid protein
MDPLQIMKGELEAALKECRSALASGNKDDVEKTRLKVLDKRAILDKELELREVEDSLKRVPAPQEEHRDDAKTVGAVLRRAMKQCGEEKRAITANGAGVNTVGGIIKALVDGGKISPKVAKFFGPNAKTVVPVFAPHLAVPVGTAEGATGTASDTTGVLAGAELTLKPWYCTLPVSMGALISTDIESELPSIFGEAFGQAMDKAICVGAGSGNDALGVFIASASGVPVASDIACAAAGAPAWADYLGLALELLGTMNGPIERAAILVNPAVFKTALGAAASGYDPMKIEFLTRGTILGIPVILSSYALTTLTTGSYVAVGGYFAHYGLAIAQEITIDQIKTVGSDNITFQAFVYMQGRPLVGTSFRRLKTV